MHKCVPGWGPKCRPLPLVNNKQLQMLCVTVTAADCLRIQLSASPHVCVGVCVGVHTYMCVIYYAAESGNSGQ